MRLFGVGGALITDTGVGCCDVRGVRVTNFYGCVPTGNSGGFFGTIFGRGDYNATLHFGVRIFH